MCAACVAGTYNALTTQSSASACLGVLARSNWKMDVPVCPAGSYSAVAASSCTRIFCTELGSTTLAQSVQRAMSAALAALPPTTHVRWLAVIWARYAGSNCVSCWVLLLRGHDTNQRIRWTWFDFMQINTQYSVCGGHLQFVDDPINLQRVYWSVELPNCI